MKKKLGVLLFVIGAGFVFGYGGYRVGFAWRIPGVDYPFNEAAYYSPTAIDPEDSPSPFALKDLATQGGNVYDYTCHMKSILFSQNSESWLSKNAVKPLALAMGI